jgi:hypothetical protein
MKRLMIMLIIVSALTLSGCMEMFTFNAFNGIGAPPPVESADEITNIIAESADTESLLATFTELTDSPTFFQNLDALEESNPGAKQEILDAITDELRDVYTNTNLDEVSAEERAEAAILTAEIFLNSNEEAQEVVNTVADIALNAADDPEALGSIEDVVVDLLETAFGGVENLGAALDALAGAADAYEAFGMTLPADIAVDFSAYPGANRAVTMAFSGTGYNVGEILQGGAASISAKAFMDIYATYYDVELESGAQIIAIVTNPEGVAPLGGTNQELIDDVLSSVKDNEGLMRIIGWAGLGDLLGGLGGEE